jgi:large subunit ribosomal protein L23
MNQERLMKVLLAPHISEKSSLAADTNNQYTFKVAVDASKSEVKAAVEHLFKVEVDDVKVQNVRGKMKYGRHPGKRANWKKACVRLKSGFDIDFLSAENA